MERFRPLDILFPDSKEALEFLIFLQHQIHNF
jgi:hypothetical protein